MKIQVSDILYEISQDEHVLDESCELIESGILDSYMMIELFSCLQEQGIELFITQIDHEDLKTVGSIQKLVDAYIQTHTV